VSSLRQRIFYFIPIVAVNFWVYFPALYHFPRADTFMYTGSVAGKEGFFELVFGQYSLNRNMLFNAGDSFLFRPVYYAWLGFEKWSSGYDFFYWHLLGCGLHLLLMWFVLKLFYLVRGDIFSIIGTLFCSTLFIGMDAVIWEIVTPYLWGFVFLFCALNAIYEQKPGLLPNTQKIIWATFFLTVGTFAYELIIPFGMVFSFYLWLCLGRLKINEHFYTTETVYKTPWFWIALPCLAPLIYLSVDCLDSFFNPYNSGVIHVLGNENLSRTLPYAFILTSWYLFAGLFPYLYDVTAGDRLIAQVPKFLQELPGVFQFNGGINAISITTGVIIVGMIWAILRPGRDNVKRWLQRPDWNWRFSLFAFMLLGMLITGLVLGRMNERGIGYMLSCGHYPYFFWLFFVLLLISLVPSNKSSQRVHSHFIKWSFGGLCVLLISLNSLRVYDMNLRTQSKFFPVGEVMQSLDRFVQRKKIEPGFSFKIIKASVYDQNLFWLHKQDGAREQNWNMSGALYWNYMDDVAPKYLMIAKPASLGGIYTEIPVEFLKNSWESFRKFRGYRIFEYNGASYGIFSSTHEWNAKNIFQSGKAVLCEVSVEEIVVKIEKKIPTSTL